MKWAPVFAAGVLVGAGAMALPKLAVHLHAALGGGHGTGRGARVHTEERFTFLARAPMERVAPLFGADKERSWAPGWNPQFVYPVPAVDQQGMVFTVKHNHLKAAWANTAFDTKNGRFQYVYLIPDAVVTVITIQLTPQVDRTRVEVVYDRTALSAGADDDVRHMAEQDRVSGPEWEKQINEYLAASR